MRRKGSGTKAGRPKGSHRKLVADPDETEDHFPDECDCGHHFCGEEPASGNPARHQVKDLPETSVITTEHRLHRLRCPRCGKRVRASLPAGIERGACGRQS